MAQKDVLNLKESMDFLKVVYATALKEILRKGITVNLKGNLSLRMREFNATGPRSPQGQQE